MIITSGDVARFAEKLRSMGEQDDALSLLNLLVELEQRRASAEFLAQWLRDNTNIVPGDDPIKDVLKFLLLIREIIFKCIPVFTTLAQNLSTALEGAGLSVPKWWKS